MATHYSAEALVFKTEDRAEADRVFAVFTRQFGRLEITAKAARKINSKLRPGMQLFSLSDIEFIRGKSKNILTDAAFCPTPGIGRSESLKKISARPELLQAAFEISDVADVFIKGEEKDERIFTLLREAFEKLNIGHSESAVFQYFFWNFMASLGYAPQTSCCANCTKLLQPERNYFSATAGGIICGACQMVKDGIEMSTDSIKILRLILRKDWATLIKLKNLRQCIEPLEKVSRHYYHYLADAKVHV